MRLLMCGGVFLLLSLVSLSLAQSSPPENPVFTPECPARPAEKICVEPSVLLRLGLNRNDAGTWGAQVSFGVKAELSARVTPVDLAAIPALWFDGVFQADLLEAYAAAPVGDFSLSVGKRTGLGGPWDDTLMGRNGRWGVFAQYSPSELGWLGVEAAYLPRPGFAGGQGFLGVQANLFHLGTFIEAVQGRGVQLNPRVGLGYGASGLYWQLDRGFWADLNTPLPLGQALAYSLQCPPDSSVACWGRTLPELGDQGVQRLLNALDEAQFGLSLWWNPDWGLLGTTDPDTGDTLSFLDWLTRPQKFYLGLSAALRNYRLGLDASLAPVNGYRVYLELRWP